MTFSEIIALARRIAAEVRGGLARAARYLNCLGWSIDVVVAILARPAPGA